MLRTMKFLILLIICCSCSVVQAGVRGRVLAFIDISAPPFVDGKDKVIALRRLINVPGKKRCWACAPQNRSAAGISLLYVKKLPDGITYDAVKATIHHDDMAKKNLQKAMAIFKDAKDGAQIDGLYVYEHAENKVHLYMISPLANQKIGKLTVTVKANISLRELDDLLEKAAFKIAFYP